MSRAAICSCVFGCIISAMLFVASQAQQSPDSGAKASDGADSVVTAILAQAIIKIVEGNIAASERENGEINKLIRALSGVSVKDIEKHGICGGTNSEVRKLLGSICSKAN